MKDIIPKSKKPIPSNAKKVFSGDLFEIFQWQQGMFDGTYTTFEKAKRINNSVNVLPITSENKIILTKQQQPGMDPFIGVVGGMMDQNEDPLKSIRRELLEESGYKSDNLGILYAIHPIEKVDWIVYMFIAKDIKKVANPNLDNGEKIDLAEYSFDEFLDVIIQDNFRDQELALYLLKNIQTPQKRKELKEKLFA